MRPVDNAVEIGNDVKVNIFLKNSSNKNLTLLLTESGHVIRYNGISKGDFHSKKIKESIDGQEGKLIKRKDE